MTTFERQTTYAASTDELYAWHARPGAFERLVPPWERIDVVLREGTIRDGDRLIMKLRKGPLALTWEARHFDHIEGRQFCDEQVRGPFSKWVHQHRMEPAPEGATLVDHVDYALPMGALGRLFGGPIARAQLARMFTHRHHVTGHDLARHRRVREHGPQRVVISGASGLVGTALSSFLSTGGHQVQRLVRRAPRDPSEEIRWQPGAGEIDVSALEGTDVMIHLSGENVAQRWTAASKQRILDSRTKSTRLIAETLAKMDKPPRVLLCASAIGIYGDRQDPVDEDASHGEGFLADVVKAWEDACQPARDAGIRVVNLRIGVIMSPRGGALKKMLPPFLAGVGGKIGSGRQGMSWIALDDVVGAIHHLMFSKLEGPVNLTAPAPVSNAEFAKVLGRVIRRPTIFPLPGFVIKLLFGAIGVETVLRGALVHPKRLLEDGFSFIYPELRSALLGEMGLFHRHPDAMPAVPNLASTAEPAHVEALALASTE